MNLKGLLKCMQGRLKAESILCISQRVNEKEKEGEGRERGDKIFKFVVKMRNSW